MLFIGEILLAQHVDMSPSCRRVLCDCSAQVFLVLTPSAFFKLASEIEVVGEFTRVARGDYTRGAVDCCPLSRRGYSQSACFTNERLRYTENTPVCGHDNHSLIVFTIISK